jgi:hypothetical protein
MAEREADRVRPDRLRRQAIAALLLDAGREISPEFHRRLREHDAVPTLFGARELAAVARTGLETDIARNIDFGQSADSTAAVRDALRQGGEAYSREQRCQLIAERHPNATIVSECAKKACDGAPDAAALILAGRPFPKANNQVRLTEDLLVQATGGGGQ